MEDVTFACTDILELSVEELEHLILGSAYRSPTAELAWSNPDEFASQFNGLYDSLTDPVQRERCQQAIYNAIRVLPMQDGRYDANRMREVFIIARHLSSPKLSLYLYNQAIKMRGRHEYAVFWEKLGDIMISVITRPIEHEDVLFNSRQLVYDRRFFEFRGMLFFRVAEVRARQCVALFPSLMEYLRSLKKTEHIRLARRRFFKCFSAVDIDCVTAELSEQSIDDAADVFSFFIVQNSEPPMRFVDCSHGDLALTWWSDGDQRFLRLQRCEGALKAQRREAGRLSEGERRKAIIYYPFVRKTAAGA